MRINDRSKTDFDRAKIKLTGHFDRRPIGRYFEPCVSHIIIWPRKKHYVWDWNLPANRVKAWDFLPHFLLRSYRSSFPHRVHCIWATARGKMGKTRAFLARSVVVFLPLWMHVFVILSPSRFQLIPLNSDEIFGSTAVTRRECKPVVRSSHSI